MGEEVLLRGQFAGVIVRHVYVHNAERRLQPLDVMLPKCSSCEQLLCLFRAGLQFVAATSLPGLSVLVGSPRVSTRVVEFVDCLPVERDQLIKHMLLSRLCG